MQPVNDKTEQLIVRSLDGLLDAHQSLELQRELIRNPAAQRMMEAYSRIDALAGDVLNTGLGVTAAIPPFDIASKREGLPVRRHVPWLVLIPGAIAAGLLALALPRIEFSARKASTEPTERAPFVSPIPHGAAARNVSQLPSFKSNTGREVIGILGEDGTFYWIEVDRTQTVRQPPRAWRDPVGYGEL